MAQRRSRPCMSALVVAVVASVSVEMTLADQLVSCNDRSKWMDNASGESPCTVAYFLMLQCAIDPSFAVLPLNSSVRSYSNPLVGQCSCNTVVYNLMSACAVCQDGIPTDYATWMDGCTDVTHDYPSEGIALSFKTPQWAYVNTSNVGSFNLRAVEEAAGENDGWSPIQIVLPIIIGVTVTLIAGLSFFLYRRRLKRRYKPITDPYPSRPTHMLQDSRSYSQQSIQATRVGHHHTPSSSSLGTNSLMGRSSPAPKRNRSAAAVAWERAKMHAPRKFGGLLPDRRKVHERRRGANWSIDADPGDSVNGYNDPWHPKQGSSSSSGGRSGLHSKEASGDSQALKESDASHSSRSRPPGHGRSESQLGLLSDTSPERLHPIQDSPGMIRDRPTTRFVRGIMSGISTVGGGLGIGRQKPVAVVSRPARRGFNMDDVDSASSPIAPANPRESQYESFVFVEHEPHFEAEANAVNNVGFAGVRTGVNEPTSEGSSSNQNRHPSQNGSNGSRSRSDGSGDVVVTNGEDRNQSGEAAERRREEVLLISSSPGQDFNSMASPTEETAGFANGLGRFAASAEGENYSPALDDADSTVLHPASRLRQVAFPLPPAPPPTSTSQSYSRSNSPSYSAPGTPQPPSRILIPPGNGNSHLLVPPSIRAAGGYTNGSRPTSPSGAPEPEAPRTTTSYATSTVLPNARLFSGSIAESHIPEPPSAVSNATVATSAGAGASASEHSSSYAYTVPNPFTFDHRRGGSAGAAEALRMASPVRPGSRPAFID